MGFDKPTTSEMKNFCIFCNLNRIECADDETVRQEYEKLLESCSDSCIPCTQNEAHAYSIINTTSDEISYPDNNKFEQEFMKNLLAIENDASAYTQDTVSQIIHDFNPFLESNVDQQIAFMDALEAEDKYIVSFGVQQLNIFTISDCADTPHQEIIVDNSQIIDGKVDKNDVYYIINDITGNRLLLNNGYVLMVKSDCVADELEKINMLYAEERENELHKPPKPITFSKISVFEYENKMNNQTESI